MTEEFSWPSRKRRRWSNARGPPPHRISLLKPYLRCGRGGGDGAKGGGDGGGGSDSGLGSESPQDPSDSGDSTSMVLVNSNVGYSARR
jgi:hypothetical protein